MVLYGLECSVFSCFSMRDRILLDVVASASGVGTIGTVEFACE